MLDYNHNKCPLQCSSLLPSVFGMKAIKAQHKHQGSQLKQFFSGTSSAWNVLENTMTDIHANNFAKVTTLLVCKSTIKGCLS